MSPQGFPADSILDLKLDPDSIIDSCLGHKFEPPIPSASELLRELDTGWPWPLSAIQDFLERLWEAVVNIPQRVLSQIPSALARAFEWMWSHAFFQALRYSYDALAIVREWFRGWDEPWRSVASLLSLPVALGYRAVRDLVVEQLRSATREIARYFDGAVGGVFDAIRNAFSPVFEPLTTFARTFIDFATRLFPELIAAVRDTASRALELLARDLPRLFDRIADTLSRATDTITRSITELATTTLPSALSDFAQRFWSSLVGALSSIHAWLSDNVIAPLRSGIENIWSRLEPLLRSLVDLFRNYIERLVGHAERGDVVGLAIDSLPLLAASIAVALALDVASVKIAASGFDLDAIKDRVLKFMDSLFDPRVFTSIFFAIAIQKPLEYAVRYQFRTEIPSPGDLMRFYSKGWISRDEFYSYMARHGYSSFWTSLYERSIYVEPRFSDVFTAYVRGLITRDEYMRWLEVLNVLAEPRPGMRIPDVAIFEESMYRTPSPFLIVQAVEAGAISEEELREVLRFELVHPRFIDVMARALLWRALRDELREAVRSALEDYAELSLSRTELEQELRALGKRDFEIQYLLRAADARRRRSLRRMFVRSAVSGFMDGYLSEEELAYFLNRLGVEPEAANQLLDLVRAVRDLVHIPRKTMDERSALASRYVRMYARGLITEEELYARLSELMFSEEEIRLRMELAEIDKLEELRRMREDYLREAVRQGFVSRTDAMDYCVRYIGGPDYCRELVDLLFAKYLGLDYFTITRDERSALANALVRAYLHGLVTLEELEARLRALRFTDEEIRLRVERAELEERLRAVEEELRALDQMLKKGEIELADYIAIAEAMGVRRDVAERRARRVLAAARRR